MKDTASFRRLIGEYEVSLQKVGDCIKALREFRKQRGHDLDLDRRIELLYQERKELRETIGHLKSYLRAWGEVP